MASLDLDDLPPRIARLILGLADGEAVLVVQNGAVLRRLIAQTQAPGAAVAESPVEAPVVEAPPPEPPAEPISSPVTEQKTREIFEHFRAAIEDEF
jgi:hypothetical protein